MNPYPSIAMPMRFWTEGPEALKEEQQRSLDEIHRLLDTMSRTTDNEVRSRLRDRLESLYEEYERMSSALANALFLEPPDPGG